MQESARQLRIIGDLQRHLLPPTLPSPPGWECAAFYNLGRMPGGDFYDFVPLPDGRFLMLIADAVGHGGAAAVLVAIVRVVLHSCPLSSGVERGPFCPFTSPATQPPNIILGHLNRILVENSLEEQFMTLFCGVLDPADGTFLFANAGHPPPRWWQAANRAIVPVIGDSGLPLGIDPGAVYSLSKIIIAPGDDLLFYTDGLTEASNRTGKQFGLKRLDEIICRVAGTDTPELKSAIGTGLKLFMGSQKFQDDVTFLALKRKGP